VKVLLIDPPFYRLIGFYNRYFPLSLVNVGTVLQKAGHEVVVYDADTNENPCAMDYTRLPDHYRRYLASFREADHPVWQEVRRTIEQFRPDVIGISIWTTYAAAAFHVARISKQIDPTCPVLMGGPHATVRAEEVLSICPDVNYVVRGEGENTALELAQAIAGWGRGSNPQSAILSPPASTGGRNPQLEAIPGLSFRADGFIKHNPPRERIRNLDDLPLPDRSLLKNEKTYSSEDMGLVMTSRGCPFSCSFCATDARQVRYRSIEHVLAEVRDVKSAYGTTQFSFKDDSFTVNKTRVAEFCAALTRENLHIGWECNTRVDLVNEEMLRDMKRAGCNSIKVGIESGSEAELARMNKGVTLDQARRAAALFQKSGIHWTGYFLIGTPGETLKDIYKTLDFMYEIRPDFASIGVYEPFPGTAMFEEGLRRGLVKCDMSRQDFFGTLPNDYYKADARHQVDTIDPEVFESQQVEMKRRFHAYNKGVGRLLKRAKSRAGLYRTQPALLWADFRRYLSWAGKME
jgi:anaerobic magnesium-protoporphyrin IX monomethyl ester cyclase